MTKRMEQSRRHGRHDPRHSHRALVLVPAHLPPAPEVVPPDPEASRDPVVLRLLPQPAQQGTEERVQL